MTTNFNLRGIEPKVMSQLKKEAGKKKTSVNSLILRMIENNLGYAYKLQRVIYDDLDHLAGTWTKQEAKQFQKDTEFFEKIDEEIWK